MDRPALQRLLDDVRTGKIDVVVVYKVDRLTRSLADFAKIVEVFDAQRVSFVSVTQAFNTTTSMGRLTLNVLLSFAQFEREVTGERIRDKIAASKKKGMWMGGLPALGYDVKERKLAVNEAEAATVRYIFRRYLELETVRALRDDLAAVGVVSKRRMAADGSPYGGQRFSCGALYLMLKNRIYRGEIVHKGKAFPGEHAAIVDQDLWRRVQSRLEENRMERREGDKALEPSLLAGIVFDASSEPMTPTHAVKKGTRYRYYISRRLITGPASDNSRGQRVPASNLEALVIGRLRETQNDFARSILVRAQVHADRIDLDVGSARLVSWLLNDSAREGIVEGNRTSSANADGSEQILIRLSIRASLKRTGKEIKFIVEGVANSAPADTILIRLLVRGQKIAKRMFEPNCPPLEAIAHEERITASYATRLLRLALLAPDIVAAILAGKQPPGLTANKLMADTRLSLDWRDQRAALGFA